MSNHASSEESDSAEKLRSEPGLPEAVQATETYQTDEGTVFYDSQNPLAWAQTDTTVSLQEMA